MTEPVACQADTAPDYRCSWCGRRLRMVTRGYYWRCRDRSHPYSHSPHRRPFLRNAAHVILGGWSRV